MLCYKIWHSESRNFFGSLSAHRVRPRPAVRPRPPGSDAGAGGREFGTITAVGSVVGHAQIKPIPRGHLPRSRHPRYEYYSGPGLLRRIISRVQISFPKSKPELSCEAVRLKRKSHSLYVTFLFRLGRASSGERVPVFQKQPIVRAGRGTKWSGAGASY